MPKYSSIAPAIEARDNGVAEVVEREGARQRRVAVELLDVDFLVTHAHDAQSRLDHAELADERFPADEYADHDVDQDSAHELDRLERILGGKDAMARLPQRLIDQLQDGCVFLEDEDGGRTGGTHPARVIGDERERQTQMGRISRAAAA